MQDAFSNAFRHKKGMEIHMTGKRKYAVILLWTTLCLTFLAASFGMTYAYVKIGDNPEVKTNKLVNPTEEPTKPGDTDIKDPTITAVRGDSFMRYKLELQDKAGNLLTDTAQIAKIMDTIYYDTSYMYQGSVVDPSTLTSNIVKGESYSAADLAALVASGVVYKEYNETLFDYDATRNANPAVRYYNYTANNGVFREGSIATLFTNAVIPSDWNNNDFKVIGENYMIKITAEVCQIDNLTQDEAYAALDQATGVTP